MNNENYPLSRNKLITLESHQYEIKTDHRRFFVSFSSLCRMLRTQPYEILRILNHAGNFFMNGGSDFSEYIMDSFYIQKRKALTFHIYDFLKMAINENSRSTKLGFSFPLSFSINRGIGGYTIFIQDENKENQVSLFFGVDRIEAIEPKHLDTLIDSYLSKKSSKLINSNSQM